MSVCKRRPLSAFHALLALGALLAPVGAAGVQVAGEAAAQAADSVGVGSTEGAHLTVSLITMGPGPLVWERFGHNAIRVTDAQSGTDWAYNYGIFDFGAADFLPRLVRGDMLYSVQPWPAGPTLDFYTNDLDRTVWIQELNLTGPQKVALRDFLEWNVLPENAHYPYDYYRDNCSTRVRDALDRALGGALAAALQGVETPETYRSESQRLISPDLAAYTGLLAAMGHPADVPLTAWEDAFVPMRLAAYLRDVEVVDETGARVPLVASERVLHESATAGAPDTQPEWLPWYLVAGLVLGVVFALLGHLMGDSRGARAAFGTGAALWLLVLGLVGTFLVLLWGLTEHVDTFRNENVLQLNPLVLALAGLVPVALFGKPWASRAAAVTAGLVAALSVLGVLLQLAPGFDQPNGEIIALVLPTYLAVAWTMASWHGVQGERQQIQRVARRRR